jgi:hypothetical protein
VRPFDWIAASLPRSSGTLGGWIARVGREHELVDGVERSHVHAVVRDRLEGHERASLRNAAQDRDASVAVRRDVHLKAVG